MRQEGCWLWSGEHEKNGYGVYLREKIRRPDGGYIKKRIKAHRLAWELHRGAIPEGMEICHSCDNPSCVNPAHLFIGTHADNMADRDRKLRYTHGEEISWSKLTIADVAAIRNANIPQVELAAQYGVSFQTISEIKLRKTWKQVA